MAQTQQEGPAARTVVDDFEAISAQLVSEIAAYVSGGQENEETSANIRRIRVSAGSLQGALNSIQMMPPRIPEPPPPPPPPEPTQAPPPPPASPPG